MNMKIVAIRDRAIDAFGRPFFTPTNGAAIRSFGDELNRAAPDNPMHAHPDDYDLYELGEWNDNTGELTQNGEHPKQIAIGKQLSTRHQDIPGR